MTETLNLDEMLTMANAVTNWTPITLERGGSSAQEDFWYKTGYSALAPQDDGTRISIQMIAHTSRYYPTEYALVITNNETLSHHREAEQYSYGPIKAFYDKVNASMDSTKGETPQ